MTSGAIKQRKSKYLHVVKHLLHTEKGLCKSPLIDKKAHLTYGEMERRCRK